MIPPAGVLRQRVAELAAWCQAWPEGPAGDACWSPGLRPWRSSIRPPWSVISAGARGQTVPLDIRVTLLRYRAGAMTNLCGMATADFVESLAFDRTMLLREAGLLPDSAAHGLAGGRLLLYCRDDNLADGAAELESDGFFDTDNVPTWDTWLCDDTAPPDARARQHCLVAWIPPSHVDLADRGISVNPEECIVWADGTGFERRTIHAQVADELRHRGLRHP